MEQLKLLSGVTDGIPVIGHIKGGIHYAAGDKEGGEQAMKAASRTTGVIGGGVGGFLVGGPVGAVAGGVSGGVAMDGIMTGAESAIEGEYKPNGILKGIDDSINAKGSKKAGHIFDTVFIPFGDALAGYGAGKACANIKAARAGAGGAASASELASVIADAEAMEAGTMEIHPNILAEQRAFAEASRNFPEVQQMATNQGGAFSRPTNVLPTTMSESA